MDPTHVEKLISIKGIVIRCSEIVPEMKEAAFKCSKCHSIEAPNESKGRQQSTISGRLTPQVPS